MRPEQRATELRVLLAKSVPRGAYPNTRAAPRLVACTAPAARAAASSTQRRFSRALASQPSLFTDPAIAPPGVRSTTLWGPCSGLGPVPARQAAGPARVRDARSGTRLALVAAVSAPYSVAVTGVVGVVDSTPPLAGPARGAGCCMLWCRPVSIGRVIGTTAAPASMPVQSSSRPVPLSPAPVPPERPPALSP